MVASTNHLVGSNYFIVTKEEERCLKENNEIDTNQVSSSVQSRRAIKKISRREGICNKDSEDEGGGWGGGWLWGWKGGWGDDWPASLRTSPCQRWRGRRRWRVQAGPCSSPSFKFSLEDWRAQSLLVSSSKVSQRMNILAQMISDFLKCHKYFYVLSDQILHKHKKIFVQMVLWSFPNTLFPNQLQWSD